jgi:stress-induced-phosphoprotein 1
MTYYTNKAAVYMEMKNFEKCIEECDNAIKKSQEGYYDYAKMGKALARKANAMLAQNKFDEAIDLFKSSLLENNDPNVKDQMKKAERHKKEFEDKMMIDPEKAEEHRLKGNELYEKADFPGAVKEYTEGLRRDPQSKALYSNRCAAYMKLVEWQYAEKDCEQCLKFDPHFVKAWGRKGTIHHQLKEYHKALDAFDKGLKLDPENKECKEGKIKTM